MNQRTRGRRGIRSWALALAAPLALVPAGAHAQPAAEAAPAGSRPPAHEESAAEPPAADSRQEQAAALFDQGMALFDDENWSGALAAFERAYELAPHYVVLFNVGACRKALHDYPGAVDAFESYLREGGERVSPERRAETERVIVEARSLIATVVIVVDRDGADIMVDGVRRGTSPLAEPILLGAGDHVVAARAEGLAPVETRLALVGGETRTVDLRFGAGPAVGATTTTTAGPSTEAGGLSQAWFWTAVGTAGALAIAGAVTGGMTLVEESDFEDAVTRCQAGTVAACGEGNAIADRYDDYQLATNILLPAAGAAAVGALVLFFFTEFGREQTPVGAVGVSAGRGAFGLSASFRF